MQGTLSEIDIRSIFQLIALGQRTGELFVEAYPSSPIGLKSDIFRQNHNYVSNKKANAPFWFVFFVNGQIVYATGHDDRRLGRLRDYLRFYRVHLTQAYLAPEEIAITNEPEYAYLWFLLEKQMITPQQGRQIIQSMVKETLFDLLSLHHGSFVFEISAALAPQLTRLAVAPLIPKIIQQVQQWKQFYPQIQWPQQCLHISNAVALENSLPQAAYQSLVHWADGKTSLRQLSRYLNRDLLTLARGIYPYVERGWLSLTHSSAETPPSSLNTSDEHSLKTNPTIVCIDDDPVIGQIIKEILSSHHYLVTAINDPLVALAQLFKIKPDLILCDINMPELDGYELCAMIRRSQTFCQTPLIMLTGKDAFMDRVRARMAGATDYLTKPFGENELLLLLERYIKPLAQTDSKLNPTALA